MADNEKFMNNKKISDITPEMLIIEHLNNTSELKTFEDTIDVWNAVDRNLYLGDIDDDIAVAFASTIRYYNHLDKDIPVKDRRPIKVYINSGGGSLTGALTIADSISISKTPVYTINMGCAYSGGLLAFITGHKRFAYPSSSFLFHEGSTEPNHMDAGKFRNFADYYEKLINKMKNYFLTCTKMTEDFYKDKYRDDLWLFVDDAMELGIVDEILEEELN